MSEVYDINNPDSQTVSIVPDLIAAIVTSAEAAIIGKDLQGRVIAWNKAAERVFGYRVEEIVGTSFWRLIPTELRANAIKIYEQISDGKRIEPFETLAQSKNGRLIHVSVTISPIKTPDGRIAGSSTIALDITELKRQEREIARLSRLHAALSQIMATITRAPVRDTLFQKICEPLVQKGGFRMVWIGLHDPETHLLMPVARHGDTGNYLDSIAVYTDDRPEGHGPTGSAFRQGRPYISNDVLNDPTTLPWREQMSSHGWRGSASFPIAASGKICGVMTVYAEETGFFEDKEVALLTEAADHISFALDNFTHEDERREAEQAVQRERDFTASLINSLPSVLYLYDENGRFLRWNQNFARVTGYTGDEIATMQLTDFFLQPDRASLREHIREVFMGGESSVEAYFLSKDGHRTPYHFTGVRIEIDGRQCLVGVGIDITQRKRAEQARQAAEDVTRDARSELARVARVSLLGEFTASIAHEVNQPLAAIVTNSGATMRWLARQPANLNEAREAINRITRDANRAVEVINRVRRLVTRTPPDFVSVDLNRVVTDVLLIMRRDLTNAHVQPHIELEAGLAPVRGDFIQLQQVTLNLIRNGIEAMKPVTDWPRVLRIRTSMVKTGDVLVAVEDSGTGLDAAAQNQIFEHFFTTKIGGTGLGLPISRSIVEGHGGRLWASPAPSHGTIFQFTVPLAPGPAA